MLWDGEWLKVRAMRKANGRSPAQEWLDVADATSQGRFLAAMKVIETSWRSGRQVPDRVSPLEASKQGLSEIRLTPKGSKAPHLRALGKRDGQTLWVATVFKKQTNQLKKKDINQGDLVAEDWAKGKTGGTGHDA